jgi:hypothetical protein
VVFARTNAKRRLSCTVTLVLRLKDAGFFVNGSLLGVLLLMSPLKWGCLGLLPIGGGTGIRPKERLVSLTGLLGLTLHRTRHLLKSRFGFLSCAGNGSWARSVSV